MSVLTDYLEQGYALHTLLRILALPRSSYYYKPTGKKAGKRASNLLYKGKHRVTIDVLLADIKQLLRQEFVDYGYYKTYVYLKNELGYSIGSTRVYRIMKQHNLLKFQRHQQKRTNRKWVKELVPTVEKPFTFLELDIKYVYLQGTRSNAMILTILDVYSRWNLGHYIAANIGKVDVINLFKKVLKNYPEVQGCTIRNDNGSQFIATLVQEFLAESNIFQEFTKPATPEQNAHIESYHSIMESAVCQRFEFENMQDFKQTMERFKIFYNFHRIHGGIGYTSPAKFLENKGVSMHKKVA